MTGRVDRSRARLDDAAMPARALPCCGLALLLATCPRAQAGDQKDRPGTRQEPPSGYAIPAAPALDPAAALAAFTVEPGLRVELAAAEPLVVAPVAMQFDGDGRLWVVEMRGYMPDVDGSGERVANGVVAVLVDGDGDGTFDERHEFLGGLVLPRAVCVLRGAALVLAPPRLLLCRDRDGDLRADETITLFDGLGGLESPEHAPNGMLWALDNRIYLAKHDACYSWDGESLRREPSPALGQWGISEDDAGRLYYNDNSTHLRVDLLPRQLAMSSGHGRGPGLDHVPCRDQSVWPLRVTPGVNRGYQPGVLKAGRLTAFTAACSPCVYRGDAMPTHRGHVFVCEPAANLVRCDALAREGGLLRARPCVPGREVLASRDERFRPVALAEGRDGGLYVADMARGVIQHRLFVTTFLRRQVEERGLASPLDRGRIWRLVGEDGRKPAAMRLSAASADTLVETLGHPAGAWRDQAQRELVLRGGAAAVAKLDVCVRAGVWPAALHALWTLRGLARLERGTLLAATFAADARLRAAGYRIAGEILAGRRDTLLASTLLHRSADEDDVEAARILALVLGRADLPAMPEAACALAARFQEDALLVPALVTGLAGHELAVLGEALRRPDEAEAGGLRLLELSAAAVTRRQDAHELAPLLDLVAAATARPRQFEALVAGMVAGAPRAQKAVRRGALGGDPEVRRGAARLAETLPASLQERWAPLLPAFAAPWGASDAADLAPAERQRLERGQAVFAICAGCHGSRGEGTGEGPPFVQSEWLAGAPERLVRIVMHGLEGEIEVDGQTWNRAMPKVAIAADDIAAVLTYVRHTFAAAAPVDPDLVRAVAAATAGRDRPFTPAELRD